MPFGQRNRRRVHRCGAALIVWVAVFVAAGCSGNSVDPVPQTQLPMPVSSPAASASPSPAPSAAPSMEVRRVKYLYAVVALGTRNGAQAVSERSFKAAKDAVAVLEESLRGTYEFSVRNGGVVRVPLTNREERTFRDSGLVPGGEGESAAKRLYIEKLRAALREIGPDKVARYDGVVASVVLDMPEAELWLETDGATGGIFLEPIRFEQEAATGAGVMTEIITNVEVATRQESTRILAHEIGHSFGLGHAGIAECHVESSAPWDGSLPVQMTDSECGVEEYGDHTNIMGRAEVPRQAEQPELLNALQIRQMGVLPDAEVVDITTGMVTSGTTVEYTLHTLSSADEGVRLIALPVVPGAKTPISNQEWDDAGSRPYLVLSPEYDAPTDVTVPRRFTNQSLKIFYALTTTAPPENNHVSSYAIPLTTTDENFNAPKDIGAPPGYTGPIFVDQGGNTVSIVSHQPASVTVRIDFNRG